jgi:ribosomal protein S27E
MTNKQLVKKVYNKNFKGNYSVRGGKALKLTKLQVNAGGHFQIACPHCGRVSHVYNGAWCALGCLGCKRIVEKTEFYRLTFI